MISFHIRHLSSSLDLDYIVDIHSFLVFQVYIVASLYLSQLNKIVVTSVAIFTNLFVSNFSFLFALFSQLGLGGPGLGPIFGTPFGPSLGLGLGLDPVSVHLGHGLVRSLLTMNMRT